jgi:gliding motility-associated-like protein
MTSFLQRIRTLFCYCTLIVVCLGISCQSVLSQDTSRKNKKPKIVGQRALSINEGESITIQLIDLTVEDPDNWFYPIGFSLAVYPGSNYTLSGNTVIPNKGFAGDLTVPVTVNDGRDNSDKFNLLITVQRATHENVSPVIVGQNPISMDEDKTIQLLPSHLIITDPDDTNFALTLGGGDHYTFSGDVIKPEANYNGNILVPVQVSDKASTSDPYTVTISVHPVNDIPKITAQQALSTIASTPLALNLSYLTVQDPDNSYPKDFSLLILNGNGYTVSGTSVTPNADFSGNLVVSVKVNDGSADSENFPLTISVAKAQAQLIITGQKPVIIKEDESFTITLAHLIVNDPDKAYPLNFTLSISPGDHYTVNGATIVPNKDFAGSIIAKVTVSNGQKTSDPFNFQITVSPVNDPPVINLSGQDSLVIATGKGPVVLFETLTLTDVDDDSLALAEIGFVDSTYQIGSDILQFSSSNNIKGVFDSQHGILALIGKASLSQYAAALKSIGLNVLSASQKSTVVYLTVNDGQANSNRVEKKISIKNSPAEVPDLLEIPKGFTPNGDFVNDTWDIRPSKNQEAYREAVIRIYTRSGLMVFESKGLNKSWDGRFNGNFLPADVYFYTIELNDLADQRKLKGIVTILR